MQLTVNILGVPTTLLEVIAMVLGIVYVVLEYRANRWFWVFGVLMSSVYVYFFLERRLYANMMLNVYFVLASVYGLWMWVSKKDQSSESDTDGICSMPRKQVFPAVLATALLTVVMALALRWVEGEGGAIVWLDGLTSSISIVIMWMLAKKYYQSWIGWLVVEPIYVVLMFRTALYPAALMYVCYIVIAVMGLVRWRRVARNRQND